MHWFDIYLKFQNNEGLQKINLSEVDRYPESLQEGEITFEDDHMTCITARWRLGPWLRPTPPHPHMVGRGGRSLALSDIAISQAGVLNPWGRDIEAGTVLLLVIGSRGVVSSIHSETHLNGSLKQATTHQLVTGQSFMYGGMFYHKTTIYQKGEIFLEWIEFLAAVVTSHK